MCLSLYLHVQGGHPNSGDLAKPDTPGWHILEPLGAFNPSPLRGSAHSCSRPGASPPGPDGFPPLPVGTGI